MMKYVIASFLLFITVPSFATDMSEKPSVRLLKSCPESPNCVSSLSAQEADNYIAPFQLSGEVDAEMARLENLMRSMPRFTIVESEPGYLRVESKTLIMRFVDDLEFLWSEKDQLLHVRSASRVGHSDFGKNRKRLEDIRAQFNTNT